MIRRVVGLGAIAAATLLAAGCGTGGKASSHADVATGQTLFTNTCGACHTLAAAGTTGTIGPNLDNAFRADRQQGLAQSTIQNVVLDMIRLGSGPVTGRPEMPANLYTGANAQDVAAYVASVVGLGSASSSSSPASLGTDGKKIFQTECASCHTLKAAGTTGTIGPNLDQLKPPFATVVHQVTNGGGVMPAFKGKLSSAQIKAVASFVSSSAGK